MNKRVKNVEAILEGLHQGTMINEATIFDFDRETTKKAFKNALDKCYFDCSTDELGKEIDGFMRLLAKGMFDSDIAQKFKLCDEEDWEEYTDLSGYDASSTALDYMCNDDDFSELYDALSEIESIRYGLADAYNDADGEMTNKDFAPFKKDIDNLKKVLVTKYKLMDNKTFNDFLEEARLDKDSWVG